MFKLRLKKNLNTFRGIKRLIRDRIDITCTFCFASSRDNFNGCNQGTLDACKQRSKTTVFDFWTVKIYYCSSEKWVNVLIIYDIVKRSVKWIYSDKFPGFRMKIKLGRVPRQPVNLLLILVIFFQFDFSDNLNACAGLCLSILRVVLTYFAENGVLPFYRSPIIRTTKAGKAIKTHQFWCALRDQNLLLSSLMKVQTR